MNVIFNDEGKLVIIAQDTTDNFALMMFQKSNPELLSVGSIEFKEHKKGEGQGGQGGVKMWNMFGGPDNE